MRSEFEIDFLQLYILLGALYLSLAFLIAFLHISIAQQFVSEYSQKPCKEKEARLVVFYRCESEALTVCLSDTYSVMLWEGWDEVDLSSSGLRMQASFSVCLL